MLEKLIDIYGPSGREDAVADFIEDELKNICQCKRDTMGNLICHFPGKGKKLLLAAHMDEIAVMVTFIEENGFLRFAPVGGLSPHSLLYKRIKFKHIVKGVIAYPEKIDKDKLKISDMYIDIGATTREEAQNCVEVGEMAVFESLYQNDGKYITSGKLDDRLGCYILIELAKRIKKSTYDLYLVFTVQEEVGLRGAGPAAYPIEADIAVAVDVTDTGDTPGAEPMAVKLGGGTAIKVKDGRMIASHKVREKLENLCKEHNIPYQLEVLAAGTTDGAALQTIGRGVPTGAVSVPTRYIHTTSEKVAVSDVEASIKLLEKLVLGDEIK